MDKSLSSNSEYKNNTLFCITSKESKRKSKIRKLEDLRSKQVDYKQFSNLLSLISNLLKAGLPRQLSLARNEGYRSRFGFTLAEALIITVMTGICILPIVGTMQNAQQRTQNFDHQSKMERYSRSKLNEIIAKAAFDHDDIKVDEETEWHYIVEFAPGKSGENSAKPEDAKLMELPKNNIKFDDFKNMINLANWGDDTYPIFGCEKNKSSKKPYCNIVHVYKTVVEIKENPPLAGLKTNGSSEDIETPNSLLGIVVRTSLIYSNEDKYNENNGKLQIEKKGDDGNITYNDDDSVQVPPVSLFAFVNLPAKGESTMWLADAANLKIYGIDPALRTISDVIDCPKNIVPGDDDLPAYMPFYIAIHPNQKILAYQTKKYIFLVNIDKNSGDNYLKVKYLCDSSSPAEIQKGDIAFRPDGKYLFALNDISGIRLTAYELEYSLDSSNKLNWKEDPTEKPKVINMSDNPYISFNTNNLSGFIPANDGYLYIVCNSSDNTSEITRVPMYPSSFTEGWKKEQFVSNTKAINSIDVSPDGTRLAVLTNDNKLRVYDTRDRRIILNELAIDDGPFYNMPYKSTYLAISSASQKIYDEGNLNLWITNSKGLDTGNIIAKSFYKNNINSTGKYKDTIKSQKAQKTPGGLIAISPDKKNVVIGDNDKQYLYFTSTTPNDELLSEQDGNIVKVSDSVATFSDLATTKIDPLAVSHGNEVDIYDLNTLSIVGSFTADNEITSLAMNPHGDMLLAGHGKEKVNGIADLNIKYPSSNNYTRFHLTDFATSTIDVTGHGKKTAFDDRTPNMAFVLELPTGNTDKENAFYNINSKKLPGSNDPYLDDWEIKDRNNAYTRSDFDLPPSWRRLDMIGLPRGGAMALYGKDDGSSMLEWIGRRTWKDDPNEGKYKLFARWTNMVLKPDVKFPSSDNFTISPSSFSNNEGGIVMNNTSVSVKDICYNYISLKTGSWSDGSSRYITPIIMKKLSGTYTVVDSAQSLELKSDQTYTDIHLNWENGGLLEDDCIIGFWNGSKTSGANKGAVAFTSASGDSGNFSLVRRSNGESLFPTFNYFNSLGFSRDTSPTYTDAIQFISKSEQLSSNFPPLGSRKLAISPDQATLAILATDTSNVPILNLYDFNKNIYGPETQLEGLLVDYREPRSNRDYVKNKTYPPSQPLPSSEYFPFPEESGKPLFGKVGTNYSLDGSSGNVTKSFPSLTTKQGPYWSSFNKYPANFRVGSGYSGNYNFNCNKRFIGYIKSDFAVKKIFPYFSEDLRLFYNNSYLDGHICYNYNNLYPNPAAPKEINQNAYETWLLQIDQSFYYDPTNPSGFFNLAIFLSKGLSPTDFYNANISTEGEGTYYRSNKSDWEPLKSEYTYILKNQPTFMGSIKAKYNTVNFNINKEITMAFSRDKAKPVLYFSENSKNEIWAFYKNKLLRIYDSPQPNPFENFIISQNGQYLIYCVNKNYDGAQRVLSSEIQLYDISSPPEDDFIGYNVNIANSKLRTSFSNRYMKLVDTINAEFKGKGINELSLLATKPHTSFNSAKVGGEYREITNAKYPDGSEMSFDNHIAMVGSCSMTVASGGVYIYGGGKDFLCYNPITNISNKTGEILKTYSTNCPMTSYDDVLYVMGSYNSSNGQVQSYNVNSGEVMVSLTPSSSLDTSNFTDEYQVNMTLKDVNGNNFESVNDFLLSNHTAQDKRDMDSYEPENKYVFFMENNDQHTWRNNWNYDYNDNVCVGYKSENMPLTVNKIRISNLNSKNDNYGLKDFELWGANSAGYSDGIILTSGTINEKDNTTYSKIFENEFVNNKCFKYFRLHPKSNFRGTIKAHPLSPVGVFESSSNSVVVNALQLWRTGVKRLTPPFINSSSNDRIIDADNKTIFANTGDVKKLCYKYETGVEDKIIEMEWSSNHGAADSLVDIYIKNKLNGNNCMESLSNNCQGWNTKKEANPYIKVTFRNNVKEAICAIRFINGEPMNLENNDTTTLVNTVKIEGLKENGNYESIDFTNDSNEFNSPNVHSTFITAEINTPKLYKGYKISFSKQENNKPLRLIGFELYSVPTEKNITYESPTDDNLTPLQTDDLGEVKVGQGACCSTPYGLVYSGGLDGTNATTTALLYWPHAVNKYDGNYYQYGICRSLPDMVKPRANHALVWHKGKIYAIGGKSNSSGNTYVAEDFIEYLDYTNGDMYWKIASSSNYIYKDGASDFELKRYLFGACSFRDEIFIFDGAFISDTGFRGSGIAWNPETNVVRKLTYKYKNGSDGTYYKLNPCAAVPFGSKIYIYGKDEDGNYRMFEYTP